MAMKIKYVLSLILAIVMLFTAALPAFAKIYDMDVNNTSQKVDSNVSYIWDSLKLEGDGSSQDATVEYTISESYEISIPARVHLVKGTPISASVSASNVVVAKAEALVFRISSENYDDGWTLVGEEGNKHKYSIKANGVELVQNGIAFSCPGGTASKSGEITFEPVGTGNADTYTDTLTFSVGVEDNPDYSAEYKREISYMGEDVYNKVKLLFEEGNGTGYYMAGAPYAPRDTGAFKGKTLSSISIPVAKTLAAENGNFTFTIYVFKDDPATIANSEPVLEQKILISAEKYGLSENTSDIYKLIDVDLSSYNITVGEDELLALVSPNDTIVPAYVTSSNPIFNLYREEFSQLIGFSSTVGRQSWNPSSDNALIYNFTFSQTYESISEYIANAPLDEMLKTVKATYGGLDFSVIGDGISTLEGVSNNAKYNQTLSDNTSYYGNNEYVSGKKNTPVRIGDTYWGRFETLAGMKLCVNNSSLDIMNSYIANAQELHNSSGNNPELILAYFGRYDAQSYPRAELGELTELLKNRGSKSEAEVIKTWLDATVANAKNYASFTFDQLYAYTLYLMADRYANAKIVCISLVTNEFAKRNQASVEEYNYVIKVLAEYFDGIYVEQGNVINDNILATSMLDADRIYPDNGAHKLIFEEIIRAIYADIIADPSFSTDGDNMTSFGYTVESNYVPASTMAKLVATFESSKTGGKQYSMGMGPFVMNDVESFKGKKVTAISIPVMATENLDADGCFQITVSIFKNDLEGMKNAAALRRYAIKISAAEYGLEPNQSNIYKFIDVNLRDYNITVAEDELFGIGLRGDTLLPAYIADSDLTNPLGKIMKQEFPQMCGFSQKFGISEWNPHADASNSLLFDFTFETTYENKAAYEAVLKEEADFEMMLEAVAKEYEGKKFSVFGDSISTFTGISTDTSYNSTIGENAVWYTKRGTGGLYDHTYTYWGSFIRLAGMELCVNNAWSGDSMGTGRFRTRAINLHNDHTGENPEVIFVYFGINDAWNPGRDPASWRSLYSELLGLITNKYKGAKIVCVGLTTNYGKEDYPNGDTLVPQYNEALKELCKEYGTIYVDQASVINSTNYQSYMHDNRILHPNAAGHELIFKQIVKALYKDLVGDEGGDVPGGDEGGGNEGGDVGGGDIGGGDVGGGTEQDPNSLKILTIGNSFSDDTMQYMYQIAEAAGYESITLGNLYIGGCTLNTHASNAKNDSAAYEYRRNTSGTWSTTKNFKMGDAIKEQDWDIISMQQGSPNSGQANTYSELDYLISYVRSLAPNAKLVWNMTWAYQQNSTHSGFANYNKSQSIMYQSIVSTVLEVVAEKDEIEIIVPNGTAIQNARTSYIGDNLTRDGYHLTEDLGRYTAGLTFFYAVTGRSIENISYRPIGVDEDQQKVAIESAMNAINNPWGVTESKYDLEPRLGLEYYRELALEWTPLGYWLSTATNGNHDKIISDGSANANKYYASSVRFTRETLPVGSVIVLGDGWVYRPDAWTDEERLTTNRPNIVYTKVVIITEEWWADYKYRAFNLSKENESSLVNVTEQEIANAFKIYLPDPSLDKYYSVDMQWTSLGYWNSQDSNNYANIITSASNSKTYYASMMFTRETLPVGSVIMLKSGWQYRPEAWTDLGKAMSSRPAVVTTQRIVITEAWWKNYEYRAFNISKQDASSLEGLSAKDINNAFAVYIPNDTFKEGSYGEIDLGLTALAYWNSNDSTRFDRLIPELSNSGSYYATKMFTPETLPIGSIIVVENGWKYRPDGWTNFDTYMPSRPPIVETNMVVVVTEKWWSDYIARGFNLFKVGAPSLKDTDPEEVEAGFSIYVPYCESEDDHNIVVTQKVEALALKDGEATYACSRCGKLDHTEVLPATKSLKILAIGNSFTQDSTTHLWGICRDAGVTGELVVANLYTGNCSLNTHWNNINNGTKYEQYQKYTSTTATVTSKSHTVLEALKDEDWDFVVLHQTSGSTGQADTFTHLNDIVDYVKDNCDATLIWHMPWAYQADSTHSEFPKYNNDQMQMYEAMVNRSLETIIPMNVFADIIPAATSIQNLRTSYVGDHLTRDGYHLDYGFGRYTSGLTWYAILTGGDVDAVDWVPDKYPEVEGYLGAIKESVKNALGNPYEITQSKYTTPEQNLDLSDYYLLNWDYVTNGYWNCSASTGITNPTASETSNYNRNICVDRMYSIEELPVGTIFVCDDGWRFRLEQFPTENSKYTGTRHSGHVKSFFVLTESFLNGCTYVAWSVSTSDRVDISADFAEAYKHVRIYVPRNIDMDKYEELDVEWVPEGYWLSNSSNNYDKVITLQVVPSASNTEKWYATSVRFTEDTLPVGSIIIINDGWAYRPDAWTDDGKMTQSRPGMVYSSKIVVTEEWWDGYKYRAINLCNENTTSLEGMSYEDVVKNITIYVPKTQ